MAKGLQYRVYNENHTHIRDNDTFYENDPAAGSPTATLLRLLPLLVIKYYRISVLHMANHT